MGKVVRVEYIYYLESTPTSETFYCPQPMGFLTEYTTYVWQLKSAIWVWNQDTQDLQILMSINVHKY